MWATTCDFVVSRRCVFDPFLRGISLLHSAPEAITVLLIEDDVDVSDMYRLRLTADGYEVLVAHAGDEGVGLARERLPDFIYLDLQLPGMDGFEVFESIRRTPSTEHIPVIFLSNNGDPELHERGVQMGALEFLVKADTLPRQLSEAVRRTTASRRLEVQAAD
jgi:DNA-binding response OmpR family regulator